jgi:hypothetical protein
MKNFLRTVALDMMKKGKFIIIVEAETNIIQ